MTTNPKTRPTCTQCGGHDICWDAIADWNEETQQFELVTEYDAATCRDCDNEMKSGPNWDEIPADETAAD